MPILKGTPTSYDVPSNATDISRIFYALSYAESPFFNKIAVGDSLSNKEFEWWEDELLPIATTLKAAVTTSNTSLTLNETASIKEGSLMEIDGTIYRATGEPDSTTGVVNVKVVNSVQAVVAEIGAKVIFLNNARTEGAGRQGGDYVPRHQIKNVTQIIDDFVSITGTQQAVAQNVPITDMVSDEAARKLARIYKNMARAVWYNPFYNPANDTEPRIFGGVYHFVKAHGLATGGQFSRPNIDAWLLKCFEERRNPATELWLNPLDLARFEGLITNPQHIIIPNGENLTVGHVPVTYISQNGFQVDLLTDINCKPGRLFLGSPSNIVLRPLRGRQFQLIDSGDKAVDKEERKILGEYSIEYNPASRDSTYDIVA